MDVLKLHVQLAVTATLEDSTSESPWPSSLLPSMKLTAKAPENW